LRPPIRNLARFSQVRRFGRERASRQEREPMGCYMAKTGEVEKRWLLIDGSDQVLGRLATKIAMVLMGKHRPTYTPHTDTGDFVVVVNADKIRVSPPGRPRKRMIRYHTGYFGGLKETPVEAAHAAHPDRVVALAVRRMLPKSKLGKAMLTKLKVYSGPAHPHSAQQPQPFPTTV
jgi:large subunit ribosomal protein L13